MNQARQPKGTRQGGQFAPEHKARARYIPVGDPVYTQEDLSRVDSRGVPLALTLASRWQIPRPLSWEVLCLANRSGRTVAHELTARGTLDIAMVTPDVLALKDKKGHTVAHEWVKSGSLPESLMTPDILSLADNKGWSVAHELAQSGSLPESLMTPDILSLADNEGWSVAHVLASSKPIPKAITTLDILRIANNNQDTVAHFIATFVSTRRDLPESLMTPDILDLKNKFGKSVGDNLAMQLRFARRW